MINNDNNNKNNNNSNVSLRTIERRKGLLEIVGNLFCDNDDIHKDSVSNLIFSLSIFYV